MMGTGLKGILTKVSTTLLSINTIHVVLHKEGRYIKLYHLLKVVQIWASL